LPHTVFIFIPLDAEVWLRKKRVEFFLKKTTDILTHHTRKLQLSGYQFQAKTTTILLAPLL
jgi:hypothetical protein